MLTSGALNKLTPTQMSLHTADPTDDGSVGEASGGAYARQNVTFSAASAGSLQLTLTNTPEFEPPAATYTHYAIWDNQGTPVCIDSGALSPSKTVEASGDKIQITSGSIAIQAPA